MKIVGERINTSRKPVNEAVEKRDGAYIISEAKKQAEAGAHFIEVNAGSRIGGEMEDMAWLLEMVEGPWKPLFPSTARIQRSCWRCRKR